jgi:predicted NUDIX family NTP pyrophosphohydrolase
MQQKHSHHAHKICGGRQLTGLLHILWCQSGGLVMVTSVGSGVAVALMADFRLCSFEREFPPKSGQLQWAISWLTIIFVGHLMALDDGPSP